MRGADGGDSITTPPPAPDRAEVIDRTRMIVVAVERYKGSCGEGRVFGTLIGAFIIAVIKNAARDDYDPDADDGYLTDEEDIVRRGGVTADDRVEVQPWIEKEERFSFVSSDPRAIDLDCFKNLAKREA